MSNSNNNNKPASGKDTAIGCLTLIIMLVVVVLLFKGCTAVLFSDDEESKEPKTEQKQAEKKEEKKEAPSETQQFVAFVSKNESFNTVEKALNLSGEKYDDLKKKTNYLSPQQIMDELSTFKKDQATATFSNLKDSIYVVDTVLKNDELSAEQTAFLNKYKEYLEETNTFHAISTDESTDDVEDTYKNVSAIGEELKEMRDTSKKEIGNVPLYTEYDYTQMYVVPREKKIAERKAKEEAEAKAKAEAQAQKEAQSSASNSTSSNSNSTNTAPTETTETSFANCTELREVYPNGVPSTHPAYTSKMDRDNDSMACERS